MIKRTLLAAAIFSTLPAYAGLTSITAVSYTHLTLPTIA